MQHFLGLSDASEATLRQWGNIYKLYRLYIFMREAQHCVLYVLNGEAILWHNLHNLHSFLTGNRPTSKCCFQKQQQPNHAWGSVWLFYDLQCISGRQQWGQFGVAPECMSSLFVLYCQQTSRITQPLPWLGPIYSCACIPFVIEPVYSKTGSNGTSNTYHT
jgi:hypothetical protein